jgi:hypothetical protein
MQALITTLGRQRRKVGVIAAAVVTALAVGGWAVSGKLATKAAATGAGFDLARQHDLTRLENLIGTYKVTGTDTDGKYYAGSHLLTITLAPSGALELEWDNGKNVGIGHVIGDVLAVAGSIRGRTVILTMTINPDGSLAGTWSRRTDRGAKGTERWRKT